MYAKPSSQYMSSLSSERLKANLLPFTYVGIARLVHFKLNSIEHQRSVTDAFLHDA